MNKLERLRQNEIDDERAAVADEILHKKSYYKNVDSIRKNVQFFFWATVTSTLSYILYLAFS
jgi:hypothetical protein